jgi:hypothetical protein
VYVDFLKTLFFLSHLGGFVNNWRKSIPDDSNLINEILSSRHGSLKVKQRITVVLPGDLSKIFGPGRRRLRPLCEITVVDYAFRFDVNLEPLNPEPVYG